MASTAPDLRNRRKREVRARSWRVVRPSRERIAGAARTVTAHDDHYPMPRTRGQCFYGPRPCPWIRCKYHLFVDVNPQTGSLKLNFPDLESWEFKESCALDVADSGGVTLEHAGALLNITRERIRQLANRALAKLEACPEARVLRAMASEVNP